MLTFQDIPPGSAPDGTQTVAPGQYAVSTGPTASAPGPQTMPCPYEISPSGAIIRRRAGSTAAAPDPCPGVVQLDNRGMPQEAAPVIRDPFTGKVIATLPKHEYGPKYTGPTDPAKVGEHRASVLVPICQQAGIPAQYMDACTTFLQGRGATIDQFAQLLAQDPAAVAALQQQALMAAQGAGGGGGAIWPWLLGGVAVVGAATGIALYVRHRRRSGGGRSLHGADVAEAGGDDDQGGRRAADLVRAYHRAIAHPDQHSTHELTQLAARLEVVSAAPGRAGLARRAVKLHELVAERQEAA